MMSLDDQIRDLRLGQFARVLEIRVWAARKILVLAKGRSLSHDLRDDTRYLLAAKGRLVTKELLHSVPLNYWTDIKVGDNDMDNEINRIMTVYLNEIDELKARTYKQIRALKKRA